LYQHLKRDSDGRHIIAFADEIIYLDVEDTAFVVKAINKLASLENEKECIELLLSDGSKEKLEADTLRIGQDNVLYCSVKERRFDARFLRASYYQIANHIEYDSESDKYFIVLNGNSYRIKGVPSGNLT
jgi:hypothetical protein